MRMKPITEKTRQVLKAWWEAHKVLYPPTVEMLTESWWGRKSKSNISFHLSKLLAAGILTKVKVSRRKGPNLSFVLSTEAIRLKERYEEANGGPTQDTRWIDACFDSETAPSSNVQSAADQLDRSRGRRAKL